MAPKKDKKDAKIQQQQPQLQSLYVKREPLPEPEPPDVTEVAEAWKGTRNMFTLPLPVWDAALVDTTEWKPADKESLYRDTSFSSKALPKSTFQHNVAMWTRAGKASDPVAPEEQEPQSVQAPPLEEAPQQQKVEAKAKAKPDPKGKGAKDVKSEPMSSRITTAQQFADFHYAGDSCVVTKAEWRTREVSLSIDDAMPPLSQSIASQIAMVAEHRRLIPRGSFLWELIYPQDEEGMPLYNPNGKYIVRLFVQGRWRSVLIDDVVPVGAANSSQIPHAPLLPATSQGNSIWPQLLAKALLRAYQPDLKSAALPVVMALTGWLPFQLPLTWESLQTAHATRAFCCLQMLSEVDVEARQREAVLAVQVDSDQRNNRKPAIPGAATVPPLNMGGATPLAAVPKLAAQPSEAMLQFLICELEEEPPQARLKASTWRPAGGTAHKAVIKEAESEVEEDEEVPRRSSEDIAPSEPGDEDDEEDEDREAQRSPLGDEAPALSARSRVDGGNGEDDKLGDLQDSMDDPSRGAVAIPWPETLPATLLLKSVILEHHSQLTSGFWVGFHSLQEMCQSFSIFMPPCDRIFSACLDTTWGSGRKEAYKPHRPSLLRLCLYAEKSKMQAQLGTGNDLEQTAERKEPLHRVMFVYEPLRVDTINTGGPAGVSSSCLLQSVRCWLHNAPKEDCIDYVHLSAGDGSSSSNNGNVCRTALLPPGEHWYLVFDDAFQAGSVLSVYVDGSMLSRSKSNVDFAEPIAALQDVDIPAVTLQPSIYAEQQGFKVWAKAEVALNLNSDVQVQHLQLLSHFSDPTLRTHLLVSFIMLSEESGSEESRGAEWSVKTLMRSPPLPLMSLPLNNNTKDEDTQFGEKVKYILTLEAHVPMAIQGGTFSLQVVLPSHCPGQAPSSPDQEENAEPAPLQVTDLDIERCLRWQGITQPNDKGIVLRERITVPMGAGKITATMRVTVENLPHIFLTAVLIVQLPPKDHMRPRPDTGTEREPLVFGAPIEPKEYGGRRNWLASCKALVNASGVENFILPHVVLAEGATYLLDVRVDPKRGPNTLDDGKWLLEFCGSGDVEMGADTMEQDLEALVRRSWEEPLQDASQPPRAERAANSRKRWLKQHGYINEPENIEEPPCPSPTKLVGDPQSGGGEEADVQALTEVEELAAAIKRTENVQHSNTTISDFLHRNTVVESMLIVEDPYTVAPIPADGSIDTSAPAELRTSCRQEGDAGPISLEEDPSNAALNALGMEGLQQVRREEVEAASHKVEQVKSGLEIARENNVQTLMELQRWRDDHAGTDMSFLGVREELRGALQNRVTKRNALKECVNDGETMDPAPLQAALSDAIEVAVEVWDQDLVEAAKEKISLFEAFASFKEKLGAIEEEPLANPAAKADFAEVFSEVKKLLGKLIKRHVPISPEIRDKELLSKAAELLKEPDTADTEGEPNTGEERMSPDPSTGK